MKREMTMEPEMTIREMLADKYIVVPSYQRAYSWDVDAAGMPPKQISIFLSDIKEHLESGTSAPYYFGHFLFERKGEGKYAVIDGQQRLTTIIILMSVLFRTLKRNLNEQEKKYKEEMIIQGDTKYRFATVGYDNQFLKDYVVNRTRTNIASDTSSAKRIQEAYDYFDKKLANLDEHYITRVIDCVANALCTTHIVDSELKAIQMFIFQNNRGKKPSLLEIIKAELMFAVHIAPGTEDIETITNEIQERFKKIYYSISKIEHNIDEDNVLLYTFRVYENSLMIESSELVSKIRAKLKKNPIGVAREFSLYLAESVEHLETFFTTDTSNYEIESLINLGGIGIAFPFIIKAYKFNLDMKDKLALASALESILLRQRLIARGADLRSRIRKEYEAFTLENKSIQAIVDKIERLKRVKDNEPNDGWWLAYWNNDLLEKKIQNDIAPSVAKFILWKYENHLGNQGQRGYNFLRYDNIKDPELEHIAPQTKNNEVLESGYCQYDEEFFTQYLNCLGNYLLISKSHNCSLGNKPFAEKLATYTHLFQHREIQKMAGGEKQWTKPLIKARKDQLIKFIMDTF